MACPEIPQELLVKPLGFITVTGLDVINNAVHSAIWDAFTSGRRQDKPLNIKTVVGDYECPRRQKRTSYEFYVPKGILKKDWISKHLKVIPSLMVVFYDLDWDDAHWKEKETECASKVAVLRSSLQGRNSRLAVVLIQKNIPLPPGEDVQAGERAASLCGACELSAKSLFVLPFSDHLHGYVIRLENAFYEISQAYYTNEIRRVKSHREFLNKSQHQLLYVRHQFKIAFFSELKQDVNGALKHYRQAYLHLLEIKLTDVNNLEVKTVAGYINYKICRLCFKISAPLDAISQFRKHIDYFKTKTGIADLSFEHCAWMGQQFSLFGDLFQEAVKNGLQAIQTQHPGFYYQQAALCSLSRRKDCSRLCKYSESIKSDALNKADYIEYFGQRPWRRGCQANEPPDPAMEQAGILSLQALELNVDHSGIIIPLLSSAVAQFREYKSVRLTLSLMVRMGEEYYHAKDYAKALTLLNRVSVYYRTERWWALLTSILVTGLRCAYFTANLLDYVTFALELVGKKSEVDDDEKQRVMKNLLKVAEGQAPEPEQKEDEADDEIETNQWKDLLLSTTDITTISMESLATFIECRTAFDADSFHADEQVTLTVYLKSTAVMPVRLTNLSVAFNNQIYNQVASMAENSATDADKDGGFVLFPEKVKSVKFGFVPLAADIGNKLEVKQISINLGSGVALKWTGAGLDANCQGLEFQNPSGERTLVTRNRAGEINWDSVLVHPITELVSRTANVSLALIIDSPAFVEEFYQMQVELTNSEDYEINNVRIKVNLEKNEEGTPSSTRIFQSIPNGSDNDRESEATEVVFEAETMQPGEKLCRLVYIHSITAKDERVEGQVQYDIKIPCQGLEKQLVCTCTKEESTSLNVISPLSFSFKLANTQSQVIDKVHACEPFLLFCKLENAPKWPISILSSRLKLNEKFSFKSKSDEGQLTDIDISEGSEAIECHYLVCSAIDSQTLHMSLGEYIVKWKRIDCNMTMPSVETKITLPVIQIEQIPFYIETSLPAYGCMQKVLPISYKIFNCTELVQEVELQIEPNEAFLFAGNSQIQFRILPDGHQVLRYNMYPIQSGKVKLPKLRINLPRYLKRDVMDALAQGMLPKFVFITATKFD
eukprot:gene13921-15373_t